MKEEDDVPTQVIASIKRRADMRFKHDDTRQPFEATAALILGQGMTLCILRRPHGNGIDTRVWRGEDGFCDA